MNSIKPTLVWLQAFFGSELTLEISILLACIGLAFLVCWLLGRGMPKDSIWFGRNTVDGLLFPLLALVLTYSASLILDGFQAVPVLKIALPILISLAAIRFFARVLSAAFPNSLIARLIERFVSWLAWAAAILWIAGFLPAVLAELDSITLVFGKSKVSLRTILEGALSSAAVLVVVLWISSVIEKSILSDAVEDLSVRKIASNATRAILLLFGLIFALSAVGVDLTALSVLGGAIGVGLGFGLQKLASNYVSGFVILFERSLRIGDNVKVDNFEGRITDITTRYTLIRALNGRESIVPNEKLITERIENLSLADSQVLLTIAVSVSYASDVAQVQGILCAAASASTRVLESPPPAAHLSNFGADGLEFTLAFWITDPENGQLNVRSEINIAILKAFRAAGVEIPFPQRVMHVEQHAPGIKPFTPAVPNVPGLGNEPRPAVSGAI
ncbi:MAG: mechanosensitive ion channel family protein [Burkholderiales bacterium]